MALYESTFIVSQELTNKQLDGLVKSFSEFLKTLGGKLVKKEYWGIRSFAYAIKKQKKGHYTMLCIDCPVQSVGEFDSKVKMKEEVLKQFTIKVDNFGKESSTLVRDKSE